MDKKKLLWVGDDYRIKTGYGRVARELFNNLKDTYTIYQFSIHCQGISEEYHIFDCNDGTGFGFQKLPQVVNVVKPDILVILNDAKTICGWLHSLQKKMTHSCSIIPYVCTEYIGIPKSDIQLYNEMTIGIMAMANFTLEEFVSNGYRHPTFRLSHGYPDTIVKMDTNECRNRLGINPNSFVFFSGSKNQPRKRLDIIIRAYVEFLKEFDKKNVVLMMNCGLLDNGWDIKFLYNRLCKENNIKNKDQHIYYCSDNIGDSNKNDEELSIIYNATNVGVTTSMGESFGLIPFEQSKLGIPQIVPNWGGIIEAVPHGSIKVDTSDYFVYPVILQSTMGEARVVHYKDIATAMRCYYTDKTKYHQDSINVVKNIEGYSWKEVAKQCQDILIKWTDTKHQPYTNTC
jgi:glycosyltransferase involved in cell wall biosynthesis